MSSTLTKSCEECSVAGVYEAALSYNHEFAVAINFQIEILCSSLEYEYHFN